ncbi:unnamed protein product [Trifolium pratense]|uniref:Uncharacterized protein n=1 Tax=Trifolium pratense TaxID=57577 RepID=A0ACB0IND8_TRIPR|nr:unnamed protein product [Trifolium pratense]
MATRYLGLTLMLTISILMLGIYAQFECGGNLSEFVIQCRRYVEKEGPKTQPSKACCDALKGADFSCYCKYLTSSVEDTISIEKALYVARTCQVKNIPTDKCGSYTIPPPARKV